MKSQLIINILRWILCLPGAFIASVAIWYISNILGRFSLDYVRFDTQSFIAQFYFNACGNAVMTVAFIFTGILIAPSYKKITAYVLITLWLFYNVFGIYASFQIGYGWGIFGGFWSIMVSVVIIFINIKYQVFEDLGFIIRGLDR